MNRILTNIDFQGNIDGPLSNHLEQADSDTKARVAAVTSYHLDQGCPERACRRLAPPRLVALGSTGVGHASRTYGDSRHSFTR